MSNWDHPDWKQAARESLADSIANSPPPVEGAVSFAHACAKADARYRAARERQWRELKAETPDKPWPQSTLDATAWLRKFHPDRLPAWYARHSGLQQQIGERGAL
jgi:hypothetical protein